MEEKAASLARTARGQLLPPARWILDTEFEDGKPQRRVLDVAESGKHYRFCTPIAHRSFRTSPLTALLRR